VPSGGVDAQRVRANVREHHLLERGVPRLQARLDGRTERNGLVGIQLRRRKSAEHAGDRAAHDRHARGAADQNDFLELVDIDVAIAQRPNDRISEPGEEAQAQALELIRGHGVFEVPVIPGNDHCRPFRGAQLPPRPLCLLAQQLVQHGVLLARREAP